jgi:hypothetical protein
MEPPLFRSFEDEYKASPDLEKQYSFVDHTPSEMAWAFREAAKTLVVSGD